MPNSTQPTDKWEVVDGHALEAELERRGISPSDVFGDEEEEVKDLCFHVKNSEGDEVDLCPMDNGDWHISFNNPEEGYAGSTVIPAVFISNLLVAREREVLTELLDSSWPGEVRAAGKLYPNKVVAIEEITDRLEKLKSNQKGEE